MGALAVAIYPLAFYSSMHLAGVTVGTVIAIGSAPLFSALIERAFDRQPLTCQWLTGAIAGIIGIALLGFGKPDASHLNPPQHLVAGLLSGLLAGLTYALYSWSVSRMIQQGVVTRVAMGATFGTGGLLLLPILLITGAPLLASPVNLTVGIYMAMVPMFIGYLAYGMGLARIRASLATTITLLEPVMAAIFSRLLVGEILTIQGWIGIGLIGVCLLITTLPLAHWFRRKTR